MRIGIISLIHESNTFLGTPTTLEDFRRETLLTGDAILGHYQGSHHEVGGFLDGLRDAGEQAVPIFAAWALPSGTITADTCDALMKMMLDALDDAGPLDGLLVAPHGAGVSQEYRDLDGYWLSLVRSKVGPDMPIMCTLDPHTNLSPKMIAACNATVTYRSNPHLDQHTRGLEAAQLILRTLRGEITPTQAAAFPPIAIEIDSQETAVPPCKPMYALADQMLERDGVLSNSIALGFAFADVAEMGTSFIAVTDNDPTLARQLADELADYLLQHRGEFVAKRISIAEALDLADHDRTGGPVCLLDMGDNVGGGSPADGTLIAHAIHRRQGPRSFVALFDPAAVEQATAAGVGNNVELQVGGKTDDLHGKPLQANFTVRSAHDGKFTEPQVRHGGRGNVDMGRTVICETAHGLTVQITTHRTAPFSLNQIKSCDLDPASFKILIAKGVNAPIAAYEEVCQTMIRVNTPGVTTADVNHLTYKHRRQPMAPFEANLE